MNRIPSNAFLTCLLFLILVPTAVHSQESRDSINYVRLYADSAGVTHFMDEKIELGDPMPLGVRTTAFTSATQVGHLLIPSGFDQDWHPAPRRQWIYVLSGTLEVEAQDGEKREFLVGSIFFVEDTTGKGHQTRNLGEEDVLIAWVPID